MTIERVQQVAPGAAAGQRPSTGRPRLYTREFLLLWLANFGQFSAFHLWTPVLPLYIVASGGRDADVGLVIGIMSVTSLPARLFLTPAIDRFGKRTLLITGAVVYLLSMTAHIMARAPLLIGSARLLLGLGFAVFTGAAMALIADLAPAARRGEGIAVYNVSANLAQAIAPAVAVALFGAWGMSPIFLGSCTAAVVTVVATFLIRSGQAGTMRLGTVAGRRALAPGNLILRQALLPAWVMVFLYGGLTALIAFVPLYAVQFNLPSGGLFFSAMAGAILLARLSMGTLSDRAGRQRVILPGMIATGLSLALLALAPHPVLFLVAAVLFGIGFGAAQPAAAAFAVDRAPPERRAAATNTYMVAIDLGVIAFLPALGALAPATGYAGLFGLLGLALALGFGLYGLGLARGM